MIAHKQTFMTAVAQKSVDHDTLQKQLDRILDAVKDVRDVDVAGEWLVTTGPHTILFLDALNDLYRAAEMI